MNTKDKPMVQRSVAVPQEIDELALRMLEKDPDISYSTAIRKILRAGFRSIETEQDVRAGRTQINPDALRRGK